MSPEMNLWGRRVRNVILLHQFFLIVGNHVSFFTGQNWVLICLFNSSDGRVVRASASVAVDLGLIPSRVKPMTLKLIFTASLLDVQH